MSALATPTLEQPESTVTCRVLVQPHCGSLLQQHSKWTKKWGQDKIYIDVKNGSDFKESVLSAVSDLAGGMAGAELGATMCGPTLVAFLCVLGGSAAGVVVAHFAARSLLAAERKYDDYMFNFVKSRIN